MMRYVGGGNETPLWEVPSCTNAGVMTSLLRGNISEYNRLKTAGLFTPSQLSYTATAFTLQHQVTYAQYGIHQSIDFLDF